MEMLDLALPATNRFATAYENKDRRLKKFFDYRYDETATYEKRLQELQTRVFQRESLAEVIENFMKNYPTSTVVTESLRKFRSKDCVVVIGGQQAGLLTGPLYTIHKIISIIIFARQKEKELGVPVVPLFWIAGEDHDYDEVNHVYTVQKGKFAKSVYPQKLSEKRMVSHIPLQEEIAYKWVQEVVKTFGETAYTNDLLAFSKNALQQSKTFVDFFAYIVMEIFKDFGLLIIDSGDGSLRQLQTNQLVKQIQKTKRLNKAIVQQQAELEKLGFKRTILQEDQAANLFYYENNERILLFYDEEKDVFSNKLQTIQFTKANLLEIAEHYPEKLSTNVATRPLMQECLFPTLAFIAGPGEIAYWAELSKAFHLFDMKMPPVVPRLNITIVDRAIHTSLKDLFVDLQEVLTIGTEQRRTEYIQSVRETTVIELFDQMKQQLTQSYEEIAEKLLSIDKGLLPILAKNEQLIEKQVDFMIQRVDDVTQTKHQHIIKKYTQIEQALRPLDSPQERVVCGYYYLNLYGFHFFHALTNLPFSFNGKHKVIFV